MAIGGLVVRGLGGFDVNKIPTRGLFSGTSLISPGDEVMVLIAGGILCSVSIDSGTPVRVVTDSTKQITVLISGGTIINVTI